MHFTLSQISLPVHLGVPDEERSQEQEVLIWVRFEHDATKAQNSDDIDDTVDYQAMYDFIKNFPKNREWKLVEKLYADLKQGLQEHFPHVKNLGLSLHKFPWGNDREGVVIN